MKLYIVFESSDIKGNTNIRQTKGVYTTVGDAQRSILDELATVLEYEGEIYTCVPDHLYLDTEKTTHNGGVVASHEDFRELEISDSLEFPEHKISWEIEKVEVKDRHSLGNPEEDIARILTEKGRDRNHPVEISGKGYRIYQFSEYSGGYEESPLFIIKSFWSENGKMMVKGQWENGKPDEFPIESLNDHKTGESSSWQGLYTLEEVALKLAAAGKWDIVYDEEYPDTNGYCGSAILSDGERFLFASICRDDDEIIEHMSVRNELMPIEGTEIIRFPWTSENETILLQTLNESGDNYACDDSPLLSAPFKPAPKFVLATLHFKETPDVQEMLIIKLNKEVEPDEDDKVFFYCNGVSDLESLKEEDNGQDFVVEAYSPIDTIYDK